MAARNVPYLEIVPGLSCFVKGISRGVFPDPNKGSEDGGSRCTGR